VPCLSHSPTDFSQLAHRLTPAVSVWSLPGPKTLLSDPRASGAIEEFGDTRRGACAAGRLGPLPLARRTVWGRRRFAPGPGGGRRGPWGAAAAGDGALPIPRGRRLPTPTHIHTQHPPPRRLDEKRGFHWGTKRLDGKRVSRTNPSVVGRWWWLEGSPGGEPHPLMGKTTRGFMESIGKGNADEARWFCTNVNGHVVQKKCLPT